MRATRAVQQHGQKRKFAADLKAATALHDHYAAAVNSNDAAGGPDRR